MGTRKLAALIGLLCALFLVSAGAAGATTATITSPAGGSHVPNGSTGPVTVDFGNDLTPGTFDVTVTGPGGYSSVQHPVVTSPGPQDFTIPPATTAGSYSIEVDEGATAIATSSFVVDAPESARIMSPFPNAVFQAPASAPGVVQWNAVGDPNDEYQVSLQRNSTAFGFCDYLGSTALLDGQTSCDFGALPIGIYTLRVDNLTNGLNLDVVGFSVISPPLAVTNTSVSPAVFLPFERDGIRDTTTGRFTINVQAAVEVKVRNHVGKLVRHKGLGTLEAGSYAWRWAGKNDNGHLVKPGRYSITFWAVGPGGGTHGTPRTVRAETGLHITRTSVAPIDFYPLKVDGYRDSTVYHFTTNHGSRATLQVRDSSGSIINEIHLGDLRAGHHRATWRGGNFAGRKVAPGSYRLRIVAWTSLQTTESHWLLVHVHKGPITRTCTPGYSPCLVWHGGADYDCYGGSGNGPYYTAPGVVYKVTGSDPYGLDGDNDGLGCEKG